MQRATGGCPQSRVVASCDEGASKGQPTENCTGNFRLPLRPFIHRISLLTGALSTWDDLPSKISNNITSWHGTSDLRSFEGTTAVAVTRVTRIHSVTPHAQSSLLLRGIPFHLAGIGLLPSMLSVRPQQQHPATGKLCCRQVGPGLQELRAQHECGSKIAMRRRSVSNKISCIVEISTSKVFYKAPTCCMTPTCTRTDFICLSKPKTVAPPNILPSQVVQHAPLRIFRSLQPRG